MIPFQCRPDQFKLMFDSVKECLDYYQQMSTQPGLTTISTSTTEDQITNLELGLSITIGIVGFLFMGLVVHFVKNQWDCQISCQFMPTINFPDNFLHRLESWMESCLGSTTDSDDEYSVETPDTPTSGSSTQTPTPPPNYDNAVANVPSRAIASVSPRRIVPVAPPRQSILPRIPEMQTPIHEPISPQFFTPAIDYDPDSSADSIHSMETPAPDGSAPSTPVASISSTEFPPRSLDMIMPTPNPPSYVGPRSLPSQYRTPAYQSPSVADLTMAQSEATSTHMDGTNRYNETSLIEINTEENDDSTVHANDATIEVESSNPSPIIERGTLADFTINETTNQDTTFLEDATAAGNNNENNEETIEEVTEENHEETIEEVTEEATEENHEETIEEVNEEAAGENVDENHEETNDDDQKTEDNKKADEGDNNSGEESDNSPTNSEYERQVQRQRRLARLAKNLQSQVNYDNK